MANNSIKKFIVKLFAIVLSVCIAIGIINSYYIKGYYYSDTYKEINAFQNVPYDLQMVNFGTSHGLASFLYPDDGLKAYNLALSGEDIYHDFQTLKQFSNHLSKGCIVALVVSYFSFCMSTEEPSQKRYYSYLDKKYIRDFSYETLISAKYIPVLRSGEFIIKDLIKDQNLDVGATMMNDGASTQANENNNSNESKNAVATSEENNSQELNEKAVKITYLESHARGRAESWRSGYMTNGRRFIDDNIQILMEMVQYCYDNGFRPVLVSTPIYKALNSEFSDEELRICYFDNIKKVQSEKNVPYLDLSHDKDLSGNPDYYENSDHLISNGAQAFYEKYILYLKEIGYMK